jgi:hypothetical protein
MRRGGILILAVSAAVAFGGATPAHGAVTIGSSLASAPAMNDPGCNAVPCTAVNLSLNPANQAPGGLVSPAKGIVTSWRAASNLGVNLQLRILRPAGGATYTGAGTSAVANPGPGVSPPIPTTLPIAIGDFIGLNASPQFIYAVTAASTAAAWFMAPDGQLADGSTRPADATLGNRELLVQATIEPDVDCDRLGDESQDGIVRQGCMVKVLSGAATKGTLNLSVQCPSVTENCDNNTIALATSTPVKLGKSKAAAAAKKKKKKRKKPKAAVIPIGTVTTSVLAGQTQIVPLTLTGNANALFRQRTSVGLTATITGSGKTLVEQFTATSSNPKPKKKKKKKKK